MPKLLLDIDDALYPRLRSAMTVRYMSGTAYGTLDTMLGLIFDAIEGGKTELALPPPKAKPAEPAT